jgi:DNA processing protein
LSSAVVVAETDIKGGTMHTVQYCIDQNRNLGCYQHDQKYLELPQTKGNQMLISQGKAIPLKSQDDIEKFICEINSQPVKNPETRHSSLDNSITMEQISMPGLDKIK